ncbi:hypothetical protein K501DRAFT_281159, partial [Backusella circina FSU 941]
RRYMLAAAKSRNNVDILENDLEEQIRNEQLKLRPSVDNLQNFIDKSIVVDDEDYFFHKILVVVLTLKHFSYLETGNKISIHHAVSRIEVILYIKSKVFKANIKHMFLM